ncbi:unnamed protein product [Gongylonema pulchrum]|uniref:OTU domain-containing protein n=1 Tax=Gongylonema pulchrum TaxID=637853 RepID=A0A183E277_9BILA|nr:unnamed protein product [Gongylonema pulchrum]
MARKKEYPVAGDASSGGAGANAGNNVKRPPNPNAAPSGSQTKVDITARINTPMKRKEIPFAATNAHAVYDVADLRAQLGSFGLTHRLDTVQYMVNHRGHFEQFIDVPFDRYVNDLSRPGTYAGQDALVAFARLHEVNIIIHQLNRPLWKIQGTEDSNAPELHLSYHNGEHYSSVRRFGDIANTPAGIRIMVPAAAAPPHLLKHCSNTSNETRTERTYLHGDDEFTTLVHEVRVMNRTGCRDGAMATEALIESSGDMDQAVDYLLSIALFVGSGDEENLSKTISQNTMDMSGLKRLFIVSHCCSAEISSPKHTIGFLI